MSIVNRALTYFIEFDYQNEMLKEVYRNDQYVFKIIFDQESSITGTAYKIRKQDYIQMNFLTFVLDDQFYYFYLKNLKNSNLTDIDLRIYYYLNINEEVKYKMKIGGRSTKILFSKTNMCSGFDYPNREKKTIKVACTNDSFTEINGRFYCLEHLNTK